MSTAILSVSMNLWGLSRKETTYSNAFDILEYATATASTIFETDYERGTFSVRPTYYKDER